MRSDLSSEQKLEELLKNLVNQAPGALYQFRYFPKNEEIIYIYVSQGIHDIFELSPAVIIKDSSKLFERMHPDYIDQVLASIEESAAALSLWQETFKVLLPEKGELWIQGTARPEKVVDGSIIWYGNFRDISEKKIQQQELEYQLRFQRALTSVSSDLLDLNSANLDRKINSVLEKIGYFFDIDRSYIFQFTDNNRKMSNTYEWSFQDIEPQKCKLQQLPTARFPWWMSKLKKNQFISIQDVNDMVKDAKPEQKLLKMQNIKSIIVMPMFIENELFGFFGFDFVREKREFSKKDIRLLKIFTDFITTAFSKHLDYQKIRKLTYNDSLTGLYNRRFFEEELKRLDTERQLPLAIIVADINGLKVINDSFGHQKGDCLIKKSAELIKNEIRDEDILARHGGDEFAILLPQTSTAEAEKIVARIKRKIPESNNDNLTISISFGIAVKDSIEEEIYQTFKRADNKMYHNKLSQSKSIKNRIVKGLISTLEVKSNETKEHTVRMTRLSINFGRYLNLSNFELNRLALLSTLHDIGKITIDDHILKKPGKLSKAEWKAIKQHPEAGYNIVKASGEFALIAEEIYSHHERWNGCGYPRQLKGSEIPFLARIISIIDAYDVMTSERPYKKMMTKAEAIKEIKSCTGTQFDPELAMKFIDFLKEKNSK